MKLPNKFEFKVYNRDTYVMVKSNTDGEYYCYNTGEDTTEPTKAIHNSSTILEAIRSGIWQITEDLDEPEMKFPFTFKHTGDNTLYTAVRKNDNGSIHIIWDDDSADGYCVKTVEKYIKDGTWIVKSVGEQPPTQESVTPLTIEIDSTCVDEAIHKMKMLAQAVENVNISIETMQKLFREISPCGVGKGAVDVPDYSTFNLKGF